MAVERASDTNNGEPGDRLVAQNYDSVQSQRYELLDHIGTKWQPSKPLPPQSRLGVSCSSSRCDVDLREASLRILTVIGRCTNMSARDQC